MEAAEIRLSTGHVDEQIYGQIVVSSTGVGAARRETLQLSSPAMDDGTNTAQARSFINLVGESVDGTTQLPTVTITSGSTPRTNLELIIDSLRISETGGNRAMGLATLVAGTVTVNNAVITANSRVFTSRQTTGGTVGHLSISNKVAGTSFRINSSSATDTSTVAYLIVEP
jgi:hypothetical protein